MKLRKKTRSGLKVVGIDGNRRNKLNKTLRRVSEEERRKELAKSGKSGALKRTEDPKAPSTKITLKLNKAGNMRGLDGGGNHQSPHMAKIRAMRKFYNKQMPVSQCSSCAFASSCPQFRAGYECAFLPFFNSHQIESIEDLVGYMKDLLEANIRRAHQSVIMETLAGGTPNLENSEQLALLFGQLKDLYNIINDQNTQELTIESDDKSIIGKLFGSMEDLLGETEKALETPIEGRVIETQGEVLALPNSTNSEVANDFNHIQGEEPLVKKVIDRMKSRAKVKAPVVVPATLSKI